MSTFTWCRDNVMQGQCDGFDADKCDGCHFFEAYMQGQLESIESAKWEIKKIKKTGSIGTVTAVIACSKCQDANEIEGLDPDTLNEEEILNTWKKVSPYCRRCGCYMKV